MGACGGVPGESGISSSSLYRQTWGCEGRTKGEGEPHQVKIRTRRVYLLGHDSNGKIRYSETLIAEHACFVLRENVFFWGAKYLFDVSTCR